MEDTQTPAAVEEQPASAPIAPEEPMSAPVAPAAAAAPAGEPEYEILAIQCGTFAKGDRVKHSWFGPRQSISRLLEKGEIRQISG